MALRLRAVTAQRAPKIAGKLRGFMQGALEIAQQK
jgi:hypothetical protein